ncbi:MAG: glycosyltransferase [Deltaproteobacteria bacterium]|nr:glycosyltransferase [Deltaproteobacteria bacterium]
MTPPDGTVELSEPGAMVGARRPSGPVSVRGLVFPLLLGSTAALLLGVIAAAFLATGPWAWAVGLVYIAYDTWLLSSMVRASRLALGELMAPRPVPEGPLPTVAVLIAARDEREVLPATLEHVRAQRELADEVWIIDDGSTDDTLEVLRERYAVTMRGAIGQSATLPWLKVLSKPNSGKARSLNQALEHVKSELVVTLDADTLLEPDAIVEVKRAFKLRPELAAGCGVLRPICRGEAPVARAFQLYQTFEYLRGFLWRLAWMRDDTLVLVSGAFAMFRRSVLDEAGGFDPHSRVEDYELLFRLHKRALEGGHALKVAVLGEARASTDAPASLPAFFKQRTRWFAGFIETMFRHRAMVGNRRYGRLGTYHLIVKTIDTLLPLYGLGAFASLVVFLATGKRLDPIILTALVFKFGFDLACHGLCVFFYSRWQKGDAPWRSLGKSLLATFTEPFAFQLFRQVGALLGWIAFLRGRIEWARRTAHG